MSDPTDPNSLRLPDDLPDLPKPSDPPHQIATKSYKGMLWLLGVLPTGFLATIATPAVTQYGSNGFGVFVGTIGLSLAVALFVAWIALRSVNGMDLNVNSLIVLAVVCIIVAFAIGTYLGVQVPQISAPLHGPLAVEGVGLVLAYLGSSFVLYGIGGFLIAIAGGLAFGLTAAYRIKKFAGA